MANNIEELQEKIHSIMREERARAPKMKEIGDYSGAFSVTEVGGIDESFAVKLDGADFYDEDGGGYAVCDELYGESGAKNKLLDQLIMNLHMWTDPIEDVDLPELTSEQSIELKRERAKNVALARAALLMEINNGINESLFGAIESRLHELEKEFVGFVYDDWEETQLNFTIDGERYYMWAWEGELTKWERPPKSSTEEKTL